MEAPESVVDGVHLDARRAASAFLCADEPFDHNQRHGPLECAAKLFAKESLRYHDAIGFTQPLQNQVAQTRTNRYANHQRTGQHGDGNRDAADDREVCPPVMTEASTANSACLH
jgi:hypothetical protein